MKFIYLQLKNDNQLGENMPVKNPKIIASPK